MNKSNIQITVEECGTPVDIIPVLARLANAGDVLAKSYLQMIIDPTQQAINYLDAFGKKLQENRANATQ